MTPVFSARRRAEEFSSLIERSTGTDLTDARYAEFLEIVGALRATPPVQARAAFVADLREQLLLAAETQLVPTQESRLALPARRPRDRRIAAAVGGFAIVGATTSMAMAAQTALPGDVLYPLKRAIENVETGISIDEGQKGVTMLANATGRLDEVTELSREGSREEATAIAETLNTFTEQSTSAAELLLSDYADTGNESSITELQEFTSLSLETLAALEALVPADARDELLRAARVLTQIDAEAENACPGCGPGITEIPKILAGSSSFSSGSDLAVDPIGQSSLVKQGPKNKGGGGVDPAGHTPDEADAVPPSSVLSPDTSSPATPQAPEEDGTTGDSSNDTVNDLTSVLGDGDGTQPTSNPAGLSGVPPVDDAIEGGAENLTGDNDDAKH